MLGRRRGSSKKGDRNSAPVVHASPSPSRSLFSSWFSMFKKPKGRRSSDPEGVVTKVGDPSIGCGGDEEFWRLSFGKDGGELRGPVCRSCLSIVEGEEAGAMKFSEMVSNVRRMRELRKVERNFADIKLNVKDRHGEKETNSKPPRRIKTRAAAVQECPPDGRELQRKSLYLTREAKSPRSARRRSRHVKVSSPRLNSAAVNNVRRSRKGREGRRRGDGEKGYERCAVVKCSYDPQGDFRESMMEMIAARGVGEMEELLACYLTLNDDAYHDVIIKVFRQVWFELGG